MMNCRIAECRIFIFLILVLLFLGHAPAWSQDRAIEQDFMNPPDAARPRTWWHWTGGNYFNFK